MQLDKDFKPIFKLLETQPDPSGKAHSFGDLHNVIRVKSIDIAQIQVHEDELNLSLLDYGKLLSLSPNSVGANQTSEQGLLSELSLEGSLISSGSLPSSFSSIVDEVFELERGSSAPSFSSQDLSSSFNTSASHFGSVSMSLQSVKAGTSSPKWEGGTQITHTNVHKVSSGSPHYNTGSIYSSSNLKGIMHTIPISSSSSGPGRSTTLKKIAASKSDQDLASLRSVHSVDSSATMDEDQLTASGNRSSRLLSPPRLTGPRVSASIAKSNVPINLTTGTVDGSFKVSESSSWAITSVCFSKRRKITELGFRQQTSPQTYYSSELVGKTEGYSYASLVAEASKGNAPSSIYVSALLHVVRHCSLCIKHARLTSQMDALDIPYVEEVGLRNASSNLWFRLPFARGNTWQHICLRLGRPGSMYWDVKINDQHFRDLWELQKGSNTTPWGSGVRIANTSDIDSHIRYDPEGVVLSYHSVEADSIKKLVADIQRLSNARMFALGMRKLLGVRSDEKLEESGINSDGKIPAVPKGAIETADRLSEHMRRAFRIEAVGLISLWFSFGSSVLARFVVEWESGKEGCTMHVSPEQMWPHTK
ncbi:hypothetical protein U1Q18_015539, partial [Sarracenia purpurea var. burkii]